jgi:hypothetical protein
VRVLLLSCMADAFLGCMRLRKLGERHSLAFFAPPEVGDSIRTMRQYSGDRRLDSSDVLLWTLAETRRQLQANLPVWAAQGRNFARRDAAWREFEAQEMNAAALSKVLREPESRSLEELYDTPAQPSNSLEEHALDSEDLMARINERCSRYKISSSAASQLQEEQERELAHEKQEERQVERPPPAKAARHSLSPDVTQFVATGVVPHVSSAFVSLSACLKFTGIGRPTHWDRDHDIIATTDFARTIELPLESDGAMIDFLRSVRWILSSTSASRRQLVLISPFEANLLDGDVRRSRKVSMHLYAPRTSLVMRPFDDLEFLAIPDADDYPALPLVTRHELNLFSGQLFLGSYEDYCQVKKLLSQGRDGISAEMLKALLACRRKGQGYLRAHMGQILRGRALEERDFDK